MLADTRAFSGFAVDDVDRAREFYGQTLGLKVEVMDEDNGLLVLHLAGGRDTFVYGKPDLQPANYTMLNFQVDDIDGPSTSSPRAACSFERYEGFDQDDKGIPRGRRRSPGSRTRPATSSPSSRRPEAGCCPCTRRARLA